MRDMVAKITVIAAVHAAVEANKAYHAASPATSAHTTLSSPAMERSASSSSRKASTSPAIPRRARKGDFINLSAGRQAIIDALAAQDALTQRGLEGIHADEKREKDEKDKAEQEERNRVAEEGERAALAAEQERLAKEEEAALGLRLDERAAVLVKQLDEIDVDLIEFQRGHQVVFNAICADAKSITPQVTVGTTLELHEDPIKFMHKLVVSADNRYRLVRIELLKLQEPKVVSRVQTLLKAEPDVEDAMEVKVVASDAKATTPGAPEDGPKGDRLRERLPERNPSRSPAPSAVKIV